MCPATSARHRRNVAPRVALLVQADLVAPVQLLAEAPRVGHADQELAMADAAGALVAAVSAGVADNQAAGTSLCTTPTAFRKKS